MSQRKSRVRLSAQSGVALVEFAMLAPVLLTLGLVTYDLGRALGHHLAATEIAREGVRQAIGTRALEKGQYILTEGYGYTSCRSKTSLTQSAAGSCSIAPAQTALLSKIYSILQKSERQKSLSIAPNTRSITVEFGYDPSSPPDQLTVKVEYSYRGLSPLYYNSPIGVSLTSSYL